MRFEEKVRALEVAQGKVAVAWIGQAGFLVKTAGDKVILIDPYLSDYVYKLFEKEEGLAFKRLSAPLFEADEIEADYLFVSHEHGDHLDMDSLPVLLAGGKTQCYANEVCMEEAKKAGITKQMNLIEKNKTYDFDEFKVITVDCDHGELSPEALGVVLDFGFTKIYYSGDTSYNTKRLADASDQRPQVALLPINGAFGNLDAREAAVFAADLHAAACIPHHFWTFPKHLGNPIEAIDAFARHAPACRLDMCMPGEFIIY
ncbi:MAG: MBL fold metallo-hydrolase [Christensenella sp.]|uniref:MBL fold metallo-hydrolase n=1 Tax=Christensenella sp. TaxID=1935934 RepID=UPI002B21BE5F|nr:MBL fold metallo-hydrolase [Christensenella sp.]MEA5004087.1 MBL fold metallo-hydrolase [Christensenella sp.]